MLAKTSRLEATSCATLDGVNLNCCRCGPLCLFSRIRCLVHWLYNCVPPSPFVPHPIPLFLQWFILEPLIRSNQAGIVFLCSSLLYIHPYSEEGSKRINSRLSNFIHEVLTFMLFGVDHLLEYVFRALRTKRYKH